MIETTFLLLILFSFKHLLADFVLQTNSMIAEKGTYGEKGGIDHSMQHALLTLLIIFFATGISPLLTIGLTALDFIVHYHVDWAKSKISKNLTVNDKHFWVLLGVDQLLHYLTYIGIIYVIVS